MSIIRIFLLTLLSWSSIYCQESAVVIVDSDNKLLPFAIINCPDTFLLPDARGRIFWSDWQDCKCEHLGYEDYLLSNFEDDTIRIIKKSISLPMLTVDGGIKRGQEVVGPIGILGFKRNTRRSLGIRINRGSILTFIPYQKNIGKINSVILKLNQIRDSVEFRIRLFDATKEKLPGNNLLLNNILFNSENYKEFIDISQFDVCFPANGVFVCLDWVAIRKNEKPENWDLNAELMFEIGVSNKKSLCQYETYITSSLNLSIGQKLFSCTEGYVRGAPMIGLDVEKQLTNH